MNLRTRRWTAAVALAVASALGLGCTAGGGGDYDGGDGGVIPGGKEATFVASAPSPGAMTLSMAPGDASEWAFEVRILVTDVDEFFGAGFRVVFDDAVASYRGFSSAGSLLEATGVTTDFRAELDPGDAGVVLVTATRQGQYAGVDAVGSQLLLTLSFEAKQASAASAFSFGTSATREVTTCPAPPGACTVLADSSLTWAGGTLTVTE